MDSGSDDGNSTDTTVPLQNSEGQDSDESAEAVPKESESVVDVGETAEKAFKPFTTKLINNLFGDKDLMEALNKKPTGGTKDLPRCDAVCLDPPEPKYWRRFSEYTGPAIVYRTDEELNAKTKDVGVQTVPIGEEIGHSNNPWADEFSRYRLRQPGHKEGDPMPWTYPKVPPKRKPKVRKI